jgi:hypothetical protein
MPSARVMPACSAISLPWSQVSDQRSCAGNWARARDQRVSDRLGGMPGAGHMQQGLSLLPSPFTAEGRDLSNG